MSINDAFKLCLYISNKSQNGNISPERFNLLAPIYQMSVINDLLGNEKVYRPHDPAPQYGYGINDKVRMDLLELIVPPTTTAVAAGIAAYPADLIYIDANITSTDGYIIKEATSDEIAILNKSQIKPPTTQYPYYVIYRDGLYIYPPSITSIKMSYVKKPVDPFWGNVLPIVNDVAVYDPAASHNFELGPLVHLRIVAKILSAVGINLSMGDLTNYAMSMEATGQ